MQVRKVAVYTNGQGKFDEWKMRVYTNQLYKNLNISYFLDKILNFDEVCNKIDVVFK